MPRPLRRRQRPGADLTGDSGFLLRERRVGRWPSVRETCIQRSASCCPDPWSPDHAVRDHAL